MAFLALSLEAPVFVVYLLVLAKGNFPEMDFGFALALLAEQCQGIAFVASEAVDRGFVGSPKSARRCGCFGGKADLVESSPINFEKYGGIHESLDRDREGSLESSMMSWRALLVDCHPEIFHLETPHLIGKSSVTVEG